MSAAAHCAVIRNPFSTAVAHAKIPDGSVALSTTCRYSISDTMTDTNGSLFVLLTGGFYSGLTTQFSTTASSATVENQKVYGYSVPSRSVTKNANIFSQGAGVPNQYRIVSQGLRLSLINNSQDNDGWFEAIRCSPSNSYTDWGWSQAGTVAPLNPSLICPVINRYEGDGSADNSIFNTSNWAMNPTYIAGKARDLHKHNFILHRQENNDFIEIPQDCTLLSLADTGSTILPLAQGGTLPFTSGNNITPWWVDKQMDSILIRIRSNTAGTNAGSMVFHAHMVQHVEECYDERSDLFRFMTKCPTNLSLYNATMTAMKNDVKPSIIRSPTMAVSSPSYSSYKKKRTIKRRRR